MQEPMSMLTDVVKAGIKYWLSDAWDVVKDMFSDRWFTLSFIISALVLIVTGIFLLTGYHKEPIGELWSVGLMLMPLYSFAKFMFRSSVLWRLIGFIGFLTCIGYIVWRIVGADIW